MTHDDRTIAAISRRKLLQTGAAGGLLIGGGLLAACSSGAAQGTSSTGGTTSSKPKYGGTLRVALTGGASTDTIDAQLLTNFLDQARLLQLYNSPVEFDTNAQLRLSLAEELTPNSTATEWVMRMRPDVTFHNGKPLTADDVIFSFQRIMNPKAPKFGAPQLALLDWKHLQKLDNRTVTVEQDADDLRPAASGYLHQPRPRVRCARRRTSMIDLSAARQAPGVVAAITAADLGRLSAIPDYFDWARPVRNFALMKDRVRFVGAPVAAVVAVDRYLADARGCLRDGAADRQGCPGDRDRSAGAPPTDAAAAG